MVPYFIPRNQSGRRAVKQKGDGYVLECPVYFPDVGAVAASGLERHVKALLAPDPHAASEVGTTDQEFQVVIKSERDAVKLENDDHVESAGELIAIAGVVKGMRSI